MSRYIDADRLKQAVEHELDMQDLYLPVHFFEVVDGMEAADVQEVKHGRWISLTPPEMRTYETDVYFMCSECKNAVRFIANDLPYEHCPHCLARCEK